MKSWIRYFQASMVAFTNMKRWLRYFARNCGYLEKSENPQRENRLGELPWRATNRGRNRARPSCLPARTRQGGYESFFREESFEYSILGGERRAGGIRGARRTVADAWNNFISLLFPSSPRIIRRTRSLGQDGERVKERKGGRAGIFYWQCVWHSARFHHIPLIAISRRQFSRPYKSSHERFRGGTQEGYRCFSMNRSEDTSAMQTPQTPLSRRGATISPETKLLQGLGLLPLLLNLHASA